MNSPEDGPVGPKHVESRRYMNKIEIVTSVGFSFRIQKRISLVSFYYILVQSPNVMRFDNITTVT